MTKLLLKKRAECKAHSGGQLCPTDEAQKILSQLRKKGSHTIIDMVTVHLDIKKDCFFAEFSNLGLSNVPITDDYPEKYDRLLCGGIWCIVQLEYESEGDSSFGMEDLDSEPRAEKAEGCFAYQHPQTDPHPDASYRY